MTTVFLNLTRGAIRKNMGEGYGHRFREALKSATLADLRKAEAHIERRAPHFLDLERARLDEIRRKIKEMETSQNG